MARSELTRPGIRIAIEYDATRVLEPDIVWFEATLHHMIDSGSHFRVGQTFQLGWAVLRFVDAGAGAIGFEELDGSGAPDRFTRGVTRALAAVRLQRNVNESYGMVDELEFAGQHDRAIACTRLDPARDVLLTRSLPGGADSGWFFGCTDDDHDHDQLDQLTTAAIHALACRVPAALPFLALPTGVMVVLGSDDTIQAFDGEGTRLIPAPGSYLDVRARR